MEAEDGADGKTNGADGCKGVSAASAPFFVGTLSPLLVLGLPLCLVVFCDGGGGDGEVVGFPVDCANGDGDGVGDNGAEDFKICI